MEEDKYIEEKQNYLRQNILDKGYDGNEFSSFLMEKKGEDGVDISNWSLNDLQAVVEEFISFKEKSKNDENNKNEDNIKENDIKEIDVKEENIKIENEKKESSTINTQIDEKPNEKENKDDNQQISSNLNENNEKEIESYGIKNLKEIKCQKILNNELSNCKDIQIKVGPFQKVEGKLFHKSHITYLITTMPLEWKVYRRFSDFDWLRQILVNNYNYCLIPLIPKKKKNLNKLVGEKTNEAFLRKRQRKFEKFLNHIINDPILKNLQVVYDFLSIQKEDDFNKIKKTYEKMKPTSNVNEFLSVDGNANIEINNEKEQYLLNIKENSNNCENIFKKINISILSIKDSLIDASNKLKDVSQNWSLMKKNAIEFNEKNEVIQCYEELGLMFENLSLYLSKQNYIIFIYLREYFKFVKNNYHSMKEFINIGENLKNSFYKSFKNLKSKKEDLSKKQEISKWELDPKDKTDKNLLKNNKDLALEKILYKDTIAVNNQKQLYGFYLNRIISEHERIKKLNAENHFKGVMKIIERQTDVTTDFMTSLADNSTALTISKKEGRNSIKKKERIKKKEDFEENLDLEIKKEENENNNSNENNKEQK